jgi:phosphatidylserine/phosphatidylglycerophosphate/cardiolipin synthase-like enzyme
MVRRQALLPIIILWFAAPAHAAEVEVCFAPGEDCTARIVAVLDRARTTLLVQQYELTSPDLTQAVLAAHRRGVVVRVLLDKSQRWSRYSGADALANGGVPVAIDDFRGIAHNKVAVVDDETVIGGSFNWSRSAATRNVENVTIIRDRAIAAEFARNFELRAGVASPYGGEETSHPVRRKSGF